MISEPHLTLSHRAEVRVVFCPSCGGQLPWHRVLEPWIEVQVEPQWMAAYRIVVKDGRPVVAEVRLFPSEDDHRIPGRWSNKPDAVPEGGLSGRAIRQLRLKDPIGLLPKLMQNIRRRHGQEAAAQLLGRFGLDRKVPIAPRRPGRAGRPDLFYARWAAAYVALVEAGSRQPVKDLAEDPPIPIEGYVSKGQHASVESVRGIINEARKRRLLTRPPPGKPGGRLTAKAKTILAK
ncbi:MAG: hypothetical protein ACRDH7_15065 [Actinomycetota bacterium]